MRIAVLHGVEEDGTPEDPVVAQVQAALSDLGHETTPVGVRPALVPVIETLERLEPDLVFNVTESFLGRSALDSSIASLLNLLGLRYTGSSHAGLLLAGDKSLAKKVLRFHGLRTPRFATMHRGSLEAAADLRFPLIVKPPQEDASIGVTTGSVVNDAGELLARIDAVHREYRSPVLVEEFIDGREFYIGILGNERPEALPVAELDMTDYPADLPRVASFAAKWDREHAEYRASHTGFPELEPELVDRLHGTARAAFEALRLRDYARIDVRLDAAGEAYVIEANPNCYLARDEVFATAARRAGLDYDALIARIVELAAARYAR